MRNSKILNGNFQGSSYDSMATTENIDSCTSNKRKIYPKVGKNKNNQTRFIVQKGKFNLRQAVTIYECVSSKQECQIFDDLHPHSSRCEQKIGRITLKVFDSKTKKKKHKIIEDDFYLASCCVCTNVKKSSIFEMI